MASSWKWDVVSVGVQWLVSTGYVEMNNDQTAVILTESGYGKITGNEPDAESASLTAVSNTRRTVILVALEVETRAVLRHLPDWKDDVVRDTVFYRGRFENWDIAVAEVGAGNYPYKTSLCVRSLKPTTR